jgi:serine/threonine protein kinase
MGEVYRARDIRLDRVVAVKVLPADKVADPDRKRRFIQEAKAASALNHPHIITIHDIAEEHGTQFMVMEYVPGKALGNQGLYFLEPEVAEHKAILKLFRFETGRSSAVAVLDEPVPRSQRRLSLPADGRWLLYDQVDRRESDIMLIENFR